MKQLTQDELFIAPRQQLIDHIADQQKTISSLESSIQEIQFKLEWFQRQIFGSKNERCVHADEMQLALDLGITPNSTTTDEEKIDISYTRHTKKPKKDKPGHGRGTMPTHLPIVKNVLDPEEDVSDLVCIGKEESWHYEMKPGSLFVVLNIRNKYAEPDGTGIITAQLPPLPIEKGNAGPGLMAQVAIDKFVYHIPLDRQRKKFHNEYNTTFSESWLCDLVKNVGFWIEPLYKRYIDKLLQTEYICADETPIPVLVKNKKGKTHRGYFWIYHDPINSITIFDYQKNRSRAGPTEFLQNFTGTLQVDGYDGYNEIIKQNNIKRAACMDHCRRKFEQALSNDKERATYALDIMREWYAVEANAKEDKLTLEQRFRLRTETTAPSMAEFKKWLMEQVTEVLPKSGIGIAINYALNQWSFFYPFLNDPKVELSNQIAENKIRPIAIGRKNYMFMGSHDAAKRAAMIYSLVSIAQSHCIDPFVYIKEILTQFPAAKNTSIIDAFILPDWKPPKKDTSSEN